MAGAAAAEDSIAERTAKAVSVAGSAMVIFLLSDILVWCRVERGAKHEVKCSDETGNPQEETLTEEEHEQMKGMIEQLTGTEMPLAAKECRD